jgi:hypothetical protein
LKLCWVLFTLEAQTRDVPSGDHVSQQSSTDVPPSRTTRVADEIDGTPEADTENTARQTSKFPLVLRMNASRVPSGENCGHRSAPLPRDAVTFVAVPMPS